MATELAGLVIANVAYLLVGAAAFAAGGWFAPARPETWSRLGAAYLFGVVVLVVPASYVALLGVPVGLTAAVVGLLVLAVGARRARVLRVRPPRIGIPGVQALAAAALTLLTLVVVAYAFRTLVVRPLVESDAWAIWTLKARLLYQDAGIAPAVLRSGRYGATPYPLGLPTLEALGFGAMGRYDGTLIGVQFGGLALGYVGAFWSLLARRARPLPIALALAAAVCAPQLLYQLLTHYADVPLGLFVGLGVAAAAAWTAEPDADGWLLACAVAFLAMSGLMKSEGLMFALAAAITLLVTQAGRDWRARLRRPVVAVATLGALLIPWRLYCAAYGLSTPDYDLRNVMNVSYLREHESRVGPVVRELWHQLVDTRSWGLLVAAVLVAIATGILGRRWRTTAFAVIWIALAFGGLVLVYWVSTLPTAYNLTNSSFRTIVSLLVGGISLVPLLLGTAREQEPDA